MYRRRKIKKRKQQAMIRISKEGNNQIGNCRVNKRKLTMNHLKIKFAQCVMKEKVG